MIRKDSEQFKIAALRLAEIGWPVFPCRRKSKTPVTANGHKDATTDREEIDRLFRRQHNIAVATGDVLVIDLDNLQDWPKEFGSLGDGPEAITGREGGRHLYYKNTARFRCKNKVGDLPLDCKGHGGYVVVAPSVHENGNEYRWVRSPMECELEEPPEWLVDWLIANGVKREGESSGKLTITADDTQLELETHPGSAEGSRNEDLCRMVGQYLGAKGMTTELLALVLAWAKRCSPPFDEDAAIRVVEELNAKERANSELVRKKESKKKKERGGKIHLRKLSSITPKQIDWLWRHRFGYGFVQVLAGRGGVGKSYFLHDLIARVSAGLDFPDGGKLDSPGDVFIACAEDPLDSVVHPRVTLAGGDLDRVFSFGTVEDADGRDRLFDLSRDEDIANLRTSIESRPQTKLVVLDPIGSFCGDINQNSQGEVRRALHPLIRIAQDFNVAVIYNSHARKGTGGVAGDMVIGSNAYINAARVGWAVFADPEDEERRLFLQIKTNLRGCPGLAYRVVSEADSDHGTLHWEPKSVLVSADDILQDKPSKLQTAVDFLADTLDHAIVTVPEVKRLAKEKGIAIETLKRAKKELGVISEKGAGDPEASWTWRLPENKNQAPF